MGYPDACPCTRILFLKILIHIHRIGLKFYNREHWKLRGEAGTKTDSLRGSASTQKTKKKSTMLYKFLQIVSPTLSKAA
jgi:hypothetical protein